MKIAVSYFVDFGLFIFLGRVGGVMAVLVLEFFFEFYYVLGIVFKFLAERGGVDRFKAVS